MLADSKLPTMYWTKAVRTACYVLNRVSVTSPHNKTPYALLTGNIPTVSHFKPFGCHVTILNTSDHLSKFDGKADEGYIVGYSVSNKAYRVYNLPNKRVEESMNLRFLENKSNVQGLGHEWETQLILQGTQPIDTPSDNVDDSPFSSADEIFQKELARLTGEGHRDTSFVDSPTMGTEHNAEDLNTPPSAQLIPLGCILIPTGNVPVPTGSLPVPTSSISVPAAATMVPPFDLGNHNPSLGIFSSSSYDDEFDIALNNVASFVEVSPVPTKRISTIHPQLLIIGDPTSAVQMQSTLKPRSVAQALKVPSWVDAMQEEIQQFKFQNVWVLVDLPPGHHQEEGIDYDQVFTHVARIEAIRLFLAFASYMGFLVYQMDVKIAFQYGRIEEEVYVTQPKGTIDKTLFLKKNNCDIILVQVYVDDIIFGSTKKEWCDEFEALMKGEFQMSAMKELTFFLGIRTATTPYKAPKPKSKSESDSPVNVHLYKSMIGSLMYLTASRPDIMFTVSACSMHQVTPTTSNLEAVKKIFKYLKGQPKLGLWYPKESPLVLEAYSDSDYAGANKDRKSITGGCQFLGRRLISWQCKKQTIVATSSTEVEYVAAAN
nr:hypothetical protein [Tanacetum cinerariifolium]